MFEEIKEINEAAGKILLSFFQKKQIVTQKADGSPVTQADKLTDEFLKKELFSLRQIPVVSEESYDNSATPFFGKTYWLVDPLDGTKEFINHIPEFCINIALTQEGQVIFGSIYNPVTKDLFMAARNKGLVVWRNKEASPLQIRESLTPDYPIIARSRYHLEAGIMTFAKDNSLKDFHVSGAALKFCAIAEGVAHIYPRFVHLKQWDVAAGKLIVEESGGIMIDLSTKQSIIFSSSEIRVPSFICCNKNIDFNKLILRS